MAIQSAPYWWITCDAEGCPDQVPDTDSEYGALADATEAIDQAEDAGWFVGEGEAYCHKHAVAQAVSEVTR